MESYSDTFNITIPDGLRAFRVNERVGLIRLTQGHVTIVDAWLLEELAQWSWYTHASNMYKSAGRTPKLYAARSEHVGYTAAGKQITRRKYLHREIVSASKGEIVAHLSDYSLDNRTANLRRTTQAENMALACGPVDVGF